MRSSFLLLLFFLTSAAQAVDSLRLQLEILTDQGTPIERRDELFRELRPLAVNDPEIASGILALVRVDEPHLNKVYLWVGLELPQAFATRARRQLPSPALSSPQFLEKIIELLDFNAPSTYQQSDRAREDPRVSVTQLRAGLVFLLGLSRSQDPKVSQALLRQIRKVGEDPIVILRARQALEAIHADKPQLLKKIEALKDDPQSLAESDFCEDQLRAERPETEI